MAPNLTFSRRPLFPALVVIGSLFFVASKKVEACPFCANMGKTLTENIDEASVVVHGFLSNARIVPQAKPPEPDGTTDMAVVTVLKPHPIVGEQKSLQLPRFVPAAEKDKAEFVVFGEVVEGRLDPYRGIEVTSKEFVPYLVGALKQKSMKASERLPYFFHFLDHPDQTISGDAYKEFANAPYKDVVAGAAGYDREKVLKWLDDKEMPSYRIGLFGLLLGVCGKSEDAQRLRKVVENPDSRPLAGVDGLMGAYCILDPKGGVDFVIDVLNTSSHEFNYRYAALRTVKFILSELPEIDSKSVLDRMTPAISQPDMSDLVIDEYRRAKNWTPLPIVLSLFNKPDYDVQVIRRAIVRFALKCPDPKAKKFLEELRAKEAQFVADVEEYLQYEEGTATPTVKSTQNGTTPSTVSPPKGGPSS